MCGREFHIISGVPMMEEWQLAEPVNFSMCDGEQIAIVGRNGAGKTKLTDIISGKHRLKSAATQTARIATMAFKDCYGGDSDRDYYLQRRWNTWDVEDERILLSSGELRKYRLAKILSSTPDILILDNPYIGLDAPSREVLSEQLGRIAAEGKTQLILVLTRPDELPPFITHVVEVRDGIVLPKQSAEEWKQNHKSEPAPQRIIEAKSASETPEVIRLNNVSIRYGERTILKDLNWVVREGEKWALLGPNGSGKSTLLSLVCADNPQSYACDIELFGHKRGSGESIWDIKKHIGYVSPELHRACKQNYPAIRIVASGLNDYSGLYVKPSEQDCTVAQHTLDLFGAGHLAERGFLSLSSGEQRLVLLARAFVKDPSLLILDEPFHGLDDENRRIAGQVIEDFCARPGKTLIMVTHYPGELPSCITNTITLKKQ